MTAAIGTLLLGGCASVLGTVEENPPGGPGNGGAGGEAATCVDWVLHATPVEAARDNLAVRATVVGPAGTQRVWGVDGALWELDVAEVLVGTGVEAGERVTVLSTPETCSSATYPSGDPLDVEGEVVVILHDDAEHGLRTVTPFDGVVTPGPDGGLPASWPAGHPGL
ncbi:hypothetical protein [Isoptericola variabilis]|uniref:hypothetical protein n=1 Tax=Isoptericola variabilis TaxID=139208 RepID=UPI0002EDB13B|nr:hypothetical protein [Isoptericola variabilis]